MGTARGCVCQSSDALIEIATGQLDDCAPSVAAWEREWHRDCGEICLTEINPHREMRETD